MTDFLFDDGPHFAPLSAAFEPNDSFATAAAITEGQHTITGSGQDWFRFDAQAGILNFTMTPTAAPTDLNMELYNDQGQVIRTGFTPDGIESFSHQVAAEGTYYLRVYVAQFGANPPDGTTMSYTLDIDLPEVIAPDNNNTRATALILPH